MEPFADNLDHIKSLEREASLILAVTYLRRNKHGLKEDEDYFFPSFPVIKPDATIDDVQVVLNRVVDENRRREELTQVTGISLNFVSFCNQWQLDRFERSVVMLLMMQYIAPDFISLYGDCEFEKGRGNGMEIGTLLSLLCADLGKQLECRRYFSVVSPLMRNDIIALNGSVDDTTNILDEKVYLCERFVRFILGDNNLYNSCFRFIKQEKCSVNIDQVILHDHLKEDIIHCIDNYLVGRNNGTIQQLDSFFGYGTALTLLFHGPSGTGKTMMARAIATHFDRPIFSLSANDMREMPGSYDDIMSTLFREAALQGALVFLDECDDVFENNGRASRSLLIEIEKARCIVIMATNKPIDLDPALERRITMKVHFPIPESETRLQMWHSLMPATVELAADVNLPEFAERYQFTGGLIRNTIFLAITSAAGATGHATLNAELLHLAAAQQTATLAEEQSICRTYAPLVNLDDFPLRQRQRAELKNIAKVRKSLHERQTGLAFIISASDINTAIQVAEGVARECGLKVRAFDYQKVISLAESDKMIDPVSQRKILPLDYAFSPAACDAAITLFIDHDGHLDSMLGGDNKEKYGDILMRDLLSRLRSNKGVFCMVTKSGTRHILPSEFNLLINLEHPSEEVQMKHWEKQLGSMAPECERSMMQIVEEYPMHTSEIDYVARQAGILATIRRMDCKPSTSELLEVLSGYRGKQNVPLLFGG
jgi:SpoVK/Ycf46/Vps4 family AAA+-type ATPase